MKKILIFIIFTSLSFLTTCTLHRANQTNKHDEKILTFGTYTISSAEILNISKKAIEKSFNNISKGIINTDFPDTPGPSNFDFPKEKHFDYTNIVGYSHSDNDPSIVTFLIGPDKTIGVHLAVIIDIKNKKALKVYNYPGS